MSCENNIYKDLSSYTYMLDRDTIKEIILAVLALGLFVLAIMIIKPVIISILFGVLLAYLFYPLYNLLLSKIKNENLSALIIVLGILIIIFGVIVLIFSSFISQATNLYLGFQDVDLTEIARKLSS